MDFFGLVFALYSLKLQVGNGFYNMLNLLNINIKETISDATIILRHHLNQLPTNVTICNNIQVFYSICSTTEK